VDRALSKGEEEDIVRVIGSKSKSKGLSDLLSLLTLTAISSIQHHLSESVSSMEGILSEFAKVEKAAPGLIASNRNANVTVTESTISSNNPIQATSEEVRKVSTKGKGKEREESSSLILNDDHQAELQEVESQVLGNVVISDPDGERFEQNANGNSSDGSNSSSSSSHHHHHSNGNTLNIQSNVEKRC
jgi:hypothetical protein